MSLMRFLLVLVCAFGVQCFIPGPAHVRVLEVDGTSRLQNGNRLTVSRLLSKASEEKAKEKERRKNLQGATDDKDKAAKDKPKPKK